MTKWEEPGRGAQRVDDFADDEAQRVEELAELLTVTTQRLRQLLDSKSERTQLEAIKIVRAEWKDLHGIEENDTREDHELTPAELELRSMALRRIVEAFKSGTAIDITPDGGVSARRP